METKRVNWVCVCVWGFVLSVFVGNEHQNVFNHSLYKTNVEPSHSHYIDNFRMTYVRRMSTIHYNIIRVEFDRKDRERQSEEKCENLLERASEKKRKERKGWN